MLKVWYNSEIDETYINYHKDDKFKYYVWVGSNNWISNPIPRFIWLPHNIKKSIHLSDIPSEQMSNKAPINI